MTNPDDPNAGNQAKPDVTPQGNAPAPSWVDEVLGSSRASSAPAPTPAPPAPPSPRPAVSTPPLSGAADLKLPESRPATPTPPASPAPQDDWVARATGGNARTPSMPSGPDVTPRPTQSTSEVLSDFMKPIVNELGQKPAAQTAPAPQPTPVRPVDAWGNPAQQPVPVPPTNQPFPQTYTSSDVSQKKLIAGLLGIFLGGLGVHKFYLGMNNPGMIMLGATIGAWILGVLTMIIGIGFLIIFIPSLVGILGLVEGIIYLTKSDADFEREYLQGKKPWL